MGRDGRARSRERRRALLAPRLKAATDQGASLRAPQIEEKAADLQAAISEGANSFLFTEYYYVSIFMVRCRG